MELPRIRVGVAGWALPKAHAGAFPAEGSHLVRYAARLSAVEINSSFYRPHRPATYARWGADVLPTFRFAVKVPRAITHHGQLRDAEAPLGAFLGEVGELGPRLGPLLVQLPPSLRFEEDVVEAFFGALRGRFAGDVVCEPRHPTWFTDAVDRFLTRWRVARVAADPARVPRAAEPGGWEGLVYYRLHGTPQVYYSDYPPEALERYARLLETTRVPTWCILDNTALGHAVANALALRERLRASGA